MDEAVYLRVDVPLASFRTSYAREYWESFSFPPPSTVYGMLLSMVGEEERRRHAGAELALALASPLPARSKVLRTLWRLKSMRTPQGLEENKRPDFQELLGPLHVLVGLRRGKSERATPSLEERVREALGCPSSVDRFGGLCLGESVFLVDDVRRLEPFSVWEGCEVLRPDHDGDIGLPVWADHVGSLGTVWGRFRIVHEAEPAPLERLLEAGWMSVEAPSSEEA